MKSRSETIKKGEPDDHEYAVKQVCTWLSDNYVRPSHLKVPLRTYSTTMIFYYRKEFRTHDDYPEKHRPDITLLTENYMGVPEVIGFIEIDGKIGIKYNHDGKIKQSTPTKHDHPAQKKNDKIFERYASEYLFVEVKRLLKEEILGEDVDRERYLNKELKRLKK